MCLITKFWLCVGMVVAGCLLAWDARLGGGGGDLLRLAAGLAFVAGGIGIAVLVLGRWSRRLRRLQAVADRLVSGEDGAGQMADPPDELDFLTKSFAAVRETLHAQARQLREVQAELETVRSERDRLALAAQLEEAVLDRIDEAVAIATPGTSPAEARVVRINASFSRLTGWLGPEAVGEPLSQLAGNGQATLANLVAEGGGTAELVYQRRDGGSFPGECRVFPIRSAEGAVGSLVVVLRDLGGQRRCQAELEEALRLAGMAEIATGVLHNIGNVLTGVNISTAVLVNQVANPRLDNVAKTAQLLKEGAEIPDFLRADSRGRQLPAYFSKLAEVFANDRDAMQAELRNITTAVEHIKAIVHVQQSYAKAENVLSEVRLVELCEDALRMNQAVLERDGITVRREYADLPFMLFDRHKVIQILVNLLTNARQAIVEAAPAERLLTIGLAVAGTDRVKVWVSDNGVGVSTENLARIFKHGFTTKQQGHGFGLHRCAQAASEMHGSLTVSSPGVMAGARFELELPGTRKPA